MDWRIRWPAHARNTHEPLDSSPTNPSAYSFRRASTARKDCFSVGVFLPVGSAATQLQSSSVLRRGGSPARAGIDPREGQPRRLRPALHHRTAPRARPPTRRPQGGWLRANLRGLRLGGRARELISWPGAELHAGETVLNNVLDSGGCGAGHWSSAPVSARACVKACESRSPQWPTCTAGSGTSWRWGRSTGSLSPDCEPRRRPVLTRQRRRLRGVSGLRARGRFGVIKAPFADRVGELFALVPALRSERKDGLAESPAKEP